MKRLVVTFYFALTFGCIAQNQPEEGVDYIAKRDTLDIHQQRNATIKHALDAFIRTSGKPPKDIHEIRSQLDIEAFDSRFGIETLSRYQAVETEILDSGGRRLLFFDLGQTKENLVSSFWISTDGGVVAETLSASVFKRAIGQENFKQLQSAYAIPNFGNKIAQRDASTGGRNLENEHQTDAEENIRLSNHENENGDIPWIPITIVFLFIVLMIFWFRKRRDQ